jgi:predicted SprT family Zn-dependent metalloprotease
MELSAALDLANSLMREHGLIAAGWTVRTDNAKRRLGVCRFGPRVIGLSAPIIALNDESVIRDTVLHEIAHALAGPAAGHGPQWKAVARSIGANPQRCADGATTATPDARWVGSCRFCDFTLDRHRLTASARQGACPRCCNRHNGGRYTDEYLLVWHDRHVSRAG